MTERTGYHSRSRRGTEMEEKVIEVNFGPQHPSTHGVLRIKVKLDGEIIVDAQPIIGYLHRNAEKLSEMGTYPKALIYMDRLDYVAALNMELGYVLSVENLMDAQVPERALWIRMMMVELNRIASHLVWLGTHGLDMGMLTPFFYCWRERERILRIFDEITGSRLLYNYFAIGGVYSDLTEKSIEMIKEWESDFIKKLNEISSIFSKSYIYVARTRGVGKLSREDVLSYGVTGPMQRASGIKRDVRKDSPYLFYDKVNFEIPTRQEGDVYARFLVRVEEMRQSAKIVKQVLEKIPSGEFYNKKYSKPMLVRLKVNGESYIPTESPKGEFGIYLIGDGSSIPYRVRIRSPSFANLSSVPTMLKGYKIADLTASISSIDPVFGEVDR
ncbi:MAG: NADH-quinone oxidoreductase subunit D [Thermoplasmatales archaeon]